MGQADASHRSSRFNTLALLAALVVCLAVFAAAPPAQAGVLSSWSGIQPVGDVGANVPVTIQGRGAANAYPLAPTTAKLAIDGVQIARNSYTASILRSSAYFYYNPVLKLSDGVHTFRVEVTDTAGVLSARQWSARVVQPPTVGWIAPAEGLTVRNGRPTITMSLADNTPNTTFTVIGQVHAGTVAGPVVATFSGSSLQAGEASFTLASELVPGTYFLTATVTDAAGNARVLGGAAARSFTAVATPTMTVLTACDTCHPTLRAAHPTPLTTDCGGCHPDKVDAHMQDTEYCEDCHWDGWHTGGTKTAVAVTSACTDCHTSSRPTVPQHSPANTASPHMSSCGQGEGTCHVESLLARHAVVPSGSAYGNQCDLCHASTDPLVVAAIADGDATCGACHDRETAHGDLNAIHESTVTAASIQVASYPIGIHPPTSSDTYACTMCHATKNLLTLHGTGWNNCSMCHASGAARSSFDTWNKTCQQGGCHVSLHNSADADANHAAPMVNGGQCYYCHDGEGESFAYSRQACASRCHGAPPAVGDALPPVTAVANAAAYFGSPAQVQLSAVDAGSSVTGIYYRVDGAEWVYRPGATTTASVPAGAAGLLEFYAVDWFGNKETTKSYTVTFDLVPPVTTDDRASNSGAPRHLFTSDIGSGVATTYFSVDGGDFRVYGYFENIDGISTDGGGGEHSVAYYSVDKAGNVEPTVTVTWVIPDEVGPTSTLSATMGTSAYIESVDEYGYNPCGIKEIRYRLDGGDWVVASFPRERPFFTMPRRVDIVTPGDGAYQLDYSAVDWADNAETIHTTTLTIDTVNPTLSLTVSGTYFGGVTIPATASDGGSGVASISYQLDAYPVTTRAGASAGIYLPSPPPMTGARTYTLSVWATDRAGNTSAVYGPTTVVVYPPVDTAKPITSLRWGASQQFVAEGAHFNAGTQFKLYADDPSGIALLTYRLDGGDPQSAAGLPGSTYLAWPLTVGVGVHTLTFNSVDGAGNAELPKSISFTVEPPAMTLLFTMSNTLVEGVTWDSSNYFYDVRVLKDGTEVYAITGLRTQYEGSGQPLQYKGFSFIDFGDGPYDVEMVLHTQAMGDQTYSWIGQSIGDGETVFLNGTYEDVAP